MHLHSWQLDGEDILRVRQKSLFFMLTENWISVLETKSGSRSLTNEIWIYFTHLLNFQCLQQFHQTVKYGCQRNNILQALTMKSSETENGFKLVLKT